MQKLVGVVVGLTAEARLWRGSRFMVEVGGGMPAGAGAAARRLVAAGAETLLSFGLCGGLDPALAPGAVLVPPAVVEGGQVFACGGALLAWLGGATEGILLAGEDVAATAAAKAKLFAATGAVAVDLESGAVARAAAETGLPFAVLRAVSDPAGTDLPPAALVALDPAGGISAARLAGALWRRPGQLPALLALARDTGRARKALLERVKTLV
jgi:adenosylhomocysteine nucleosidase